MEYIIFASLVAFLICMAILLYVGGNIFFKIGGRGLETKVLLALFAIRDAEAAARRQQEALQTVGSCKMAAHNSNWQLCYFYFSRGSGDIFLGFRAFLLGVQTHLEGLIL